MRFALMLCHLGWLAAALVPHESGAQALPSLPPDQCRTLPVTAPGPGSDDSLIREMTLDEDGLLTAQDYCYGKKLKWTEPDNWFSGKGDLVYVRRFTYQRPVWSAGIQMPLIIWSHPSGSDEAIGPQVAGRLAAPAMAHGFAFMSIQYRHPTASQASYPLPAPPPDQAHDGESPPPATAKPSTDIAGAIQFARQNARQLQIDPENIFLVGQSRGSLAVLTGLMKDQQQALPLAPDDETYLAYSSKPNAVFAAQAQVTYDHAELEATFLKPQASLQTTRSILADGKPLQYPLSVGWTSPDRFSYHHHYDKSDQPILNLQNNPLSALAALADARSNAAAAPIWLRYDRPPVSAGSTIARVGMYVNAAGTDQNHIDIDTNPDCHESAAVGCLDVHHPNFGRALVDAYERIAPTLPRASSARVIAQFGDAPYGIAGKAARDALAGRFYDDYFCFFLGYRTRDGAVHHPITEGGEMRREEAVRAYNAYRDARGDGQEDPAPCMLTEGDAWPAER